MQTETRPAVDDQPVAKRRILRIWAGIALVIVVAVVAWLLSRGAPSEVSIVDAAQQVEAGTQPATAGDVAGTWTVSAETVVFDVDATTGTFVGFRIAEVLTGVGEVDAVGRTPEVTGSIVIVGTTLESAAFTADVTGIVSNDSRREDEIQDALEIAEFPTATFVLTSPVDLGDAAATGAVITVDAVGELTIHGVTRAVTVPLSAQLVGGTIVVTSSFDVTFADYGITVPSSRIVVSVEDHGPVEIQLFFVRR